jgi:hypothetical protein
VPVAIVAIDLVICCRPSSSDRTRRSVSSFFCYVELIFLYFPEIEGVERYKSPGDVQNLRSSGAVISATGRKQK